MKPRYKSKTNIFGIGLAVFGVLQANAPLFQAFLTPDRFAYFTVGVGIAVVILREVTKGPVGNADE